MNDNTETAKQFRKKPVVIEAMQMPKKKDQAQVRAVAVWMSENGYDANPDCEDIEVWDEMYVENGVALTEYGSNFLEIETLEGVMSASPGDWIIKGVQGEFYPCKPDIFAQTYEEVTTS